MATIHFHLPAASDDGVRVAYQPLLEQLFSLCVLLDPQHHPLHHAWVREMRALPSSLRRELMACSFALGKPLSTNRRWLPNPLASFPTKTSDSVGDAFDRVRGLSDERVAAELAPVAAFAEGGLSREALTALRQARRDPTGFWQRLCALLEAYWETVFACEWELRRPQLAESVEDACRVLGAGGLPAFVETLGPRVHLHRDAAGIRLDLWRCHPRGTGANDEELDVHISNTFSFVPSTFTWPHIWANTEHPWPIGITFHAASVVSQAPPRLPHPDLVRLFRACGDEVRLHALRWIAEAPRSTQELAPLVGITQAAMSKHLRRLAAAGIVEPRRDGRYVLYRLRPERLEPLSRDLFDYLNVVFGESMADD